MHVDIGTEKVKIMCMHASLPPPPPQELKSLT